MKSFRVFNLVVWLLFAATFPAPTILALLLHVHRLVLVVAAILTFLLLSRGLVRQQRGKIFNFDRFCWQWLWLFQLHHLRCIIVEEIDGMDG